MPTLLRFNPILGLPHLPENRLLSDTGREKAQQGSWPKSCKQSKSANCKERELNAFALPCPPLAWLVGGGAAATATAAQLPCQLLVDITSTVEVG